MPRADLLIDLVKAASRDDRESLRSVIEALAVEERAKKHGIMANRLIETMNMGFHEQARQTHNADESYDVRDGNKSMDLFFEVIPQKRFDDLILSEAILKTTNELIQEQFRKDLLRSYGLDPRHKILLAGAPGNGKTSYAEALAEKLMVPLLVVRYENLITSYLGETSGKLQNLFQYARQTKCVLFFDEFDVVGKERGDSHETGEIKRIVSTLLLQIDRLPSHVVVVTATNHPELLDRAVWRRFDLRLELTNPTPAQRVSYINSFFVKRNLSLKDSDGVSRKLGKASFSDLEKFCTTVLRKKVLSSGQASLESLLSETLTEWSQLFSVDK